jgi:hypothetical protein
MDRSDLNFFGTSVNPILRPKKKCLFDINAGYIGTDLLLARLAQPRPVGPDYVLLFKLKRKESIIYNVM